MATLMLLRLLLLHQLCCQSGLASEPLSVLVGVPGGSEAIEFSHSDDLHRLAREFVSRHGLSTGGSCHTSDCVSDALYAEMRSVAVAVATAAAAAAAAAAEAAAPEAVAHLERADQPPEPPTPPQPRPKLFIHANRHTLLPALVAKHSYLNTTRHPGSFDVELLLVDDHPQLTRHDGQRLVRHRVEAGWYRDTPQSFFPLRFLPPERTAFRGRAIVADPDIFSVGGDAYDLLTAALPDGATVAAVPWDKQEWQLWHTSLMLLECAGLRHWSFEPLLDDVFSKRVDFQVQRARPHSLQILRFSSSNISPRADCESWLAPPRVDAPVFNHGSWSDEPPT